MEIWRTGWNTDECHGGMFDVQDLLVQWLNEIVLDVNTSVNTQKWIRVLVTYRNFEETPIYLFCNKENNSMTDWILHEK